MIDKPDYVREAAGPPQPDFDQSRHLLYDWSDNGTTPPAISWVGQPPPLNIIESTPAEGWSDAP